eukprot:1493810-Prymnesium_polylepis.1
MRRAPSVVYADALQHASGSVLFDMTAAHRVSLQNDAQHVGAAIALGHPLHLHTVLAAPADDHEARRALNLQRGSCLREAPNGDVRVIHT